MLLLCLIAIAWQPAGDVNKLQTALTLARAHRYAEAEQVLKGVPVPADPATAIGFHRLRASIEAGLSHYVEADAEMWAALALAPENESLRKAGAVTAAAAGDSQERSGDNLAAAHSYERAVELDPLLNSCSTKRSNRPLWFSERPKRISVNRPALRRHLAWPILPAAWI
jgi:hypothetical protein